MGLFNFLSENEHRVFNYKPIYYDPEAEERKRKFGAVDGREDSNKSSYAPGTYLKGAFRDGHYQKTRVPMKRVQTIIGIVTMLLVFAILYFIAKFYQLL